jgi:hypothetical protein
MQRAKTMGFTFGSACMALLLLSGCFPYTVKYVYIDGPGITNVRMFCGDSGPPTGALFEHGKISILVGLEPHGLSLQKESFVRVRAPRSSDVSLPDPIANFTFRSVDGVEIVKVPLRAAPLDWQGPFVEEFRQQSPTEEHRFIFADYPGPRTSGSLKIPVFIIDGNVVQVPELQFERKRYGGLAPLNC